MALRVVGAGFGRTGTNSLKLALEHIGFGPCHHMFEVFDHPEQLPFWQAAGRGELPDWDDVFADYAACVDWPSALYWREIAAHYPDAPVVLSVRPEGRWFDSIDRTIFEAMRNRHELPAGFVRDGKEMAYRTVCRLTFGGRFDDRDHVLAVYRAHIEEVRRTIAPDRLLIWDIAEGWDPLCAFLGVAVPDIPFPHVNSSEEFHGRQTDQREEAGATDPA